MFVVAPRQGCACRTCPCRVRAATVLRTASVGVGIYGGVMRLTADEVDRFWSHVVKGPRETDCWLWAAGGTAAIGDDGYGNLGFSGRPAAGAAAASCGVGAGRRRVDRSSPGNRARRV